MLIDMAPTILAALDAPAGIKHTGSVLAEVVGSEASREVGGGRRHGRGRATRSPRSPTPRPTRWKSTSEASATWSRSRRDPYRSRVPSALLVRVDQWCMSGALRAASALARVVPEPPVSVLLPEPPSSCRSPTRRPACRSRGCQRACRSLATVQRVVPRATAQVVGPCPAEDLVGAAATTDSVVATLAVDHVVAAEGCDHVVAGCPFGRRCRTSPRSSLADRRSSAFAVAPKRSPDVRRTRLSVRSRCDPRPVHVLVVSFTPPSFARPQSPLRRLRCTVSGGAERVPHRAARDGQVVRIHTLFNQA